MLISNRGKHLLIRQAKPEDAEIFHQAYASDEFSQLFRANGVQQSIGELRQNLAERASTPPEALGYIEFSIILAENPIGVAVLADYAPLHRRAEFLIGIFSPTKRHASHSVEASLLILDLVFNHYGMNKLYTFVYEYNEYSQKATEKLGFIREGLLREHHFSIPKQSFISLYQNGLTEHDFRHNKKLSALSRRLLGKDITQPVKMISVFPSMEIANSASPIKPPSSMYDSDRLFNYLEAFYPQYLPHPSSGSATAAGYYYRHYPITGAFIGTSNGMVYYLIPSINNNITQLGTLAKWLTIAASSGY